MVHVVEHSSVFLMYKQLLHLTLCLSDFSWVSFHLLQFPPSHSSFWMRAFICKEDDKRLLEHGMLRTCWWRLQVAKVGGMASMMIMVSLSGLMYNTWEAESIYNDFAWLGNCFWFMSATQTGGCSNEHDARTHDGGGDIIITRLQSEDNKYGDEIALI